MKTVTLCIILIMTKTTTAQILETSLPSVLAATAGLILAEKKKSNYVKK